MVDITQRSNVGEIKYSKFIPVCDICRKELIEVSRVSTVSFYSCKNEDCSNYAELLINVGNHENPMMVGFYEMVNTMNTMSVSGSVCNNAEEQNDNLEEHY